MSAECVSVSGLPGWEGSCPECLVHSLSYRKPSSYLPAEASAVTDLCSLIHIVSTNCKTGHSVHGLHIPCALVFWCPCIWEWQFCPGLCLCWNLALEDNLQYYIVLALRSGQCGKVPVCLVKLFCREFSSCYGTHFSSTLLLECFILVVFALGNSSQNIYMVVDRSKLCRKEIAFANEGSQGICKYCHWENTSSLVFLISVF